MQLVFLGIGILFCLSVSAQKINGVNLVSPQNRPDTYFLKSIERINANWVAFCPFAFMKSGETYVRYNVMENYWGDKPQNLEQLIKQAHKKNLKVLVKPHIWVEGEGWPGDFSPGAGRWKIWQDNYTLFMDQLVEICERNGVEMLCIGTEFKNAVITKPGYWKWLIHHVRKSYSGRLTYAANWDNYMYIPFWNELDFMGIDAYFPLTSDVTPSVNSVKNEWESIANKLERFSNKQGKKIIFTECGYRSTNACAYKQWLIEVYLLTKA